MQDDKELARLDTNTACPQETHLTNNVTIRVSNCTFFWQGLYQDKPSQYSAGFAKKKSLVAAVEYHAGGTERTPIYMIIL